MLTRKKEHAASIFRSKQTVYPIGITHLNIQFFFFLCEFINVPFGDISYNAQNIMRGRERDREMEKESLCIIFKQLRKFKSWNHSAADMQGEPLGGLLGSPQCWTQKEKENEEPSTQQVNHN